MARAPRFIITAAAFFAAAAPCMAQDVALKAGMAVSRFATEGATPFDGSYVGTSFGGHVRFMLGPLGVQPELHLVARGASVEGSDLEERLRLEYLELPVMLVVPFRAGRFEPYVFGGPHIALEARCRSIVEEDGLKTNFGCDQSTGTVFDRRSLDYGVAAGAGLGHPLGSGVLMLEARHSWGLRNIYDGDVAGVSLRNRTFLISLGYTMSTRVDDTP